MYRYVFGSLDICTHMYTLHTHTRLSSSKASASSQLCQWWSCMAQLRFRTVLWPHHYQIDRCYFLVPLQGSISAQFGELISNNFQRWKWNHSLQFPSPVRKNQLDKPSTKSTCLSCLRLIEWCWKKSGPLESEIGSVLVLQHAQAQASRETEWKCVYTASLERMDRILRWQTALSQQFGASQQTKFEEICLKWRNNLAIVPEAGRALSIPSCPRETQTTKTKVASLILAQRRLQTQMAVSKRRLHARQNCGLAESMTSLQSRFRFVCGQKSTLEFGPKDLAHAQRSLRCVMDGIGQGVVGCGFAVYRFGSYLFGVWKLPVEPPRIKNNILEEGLPLAKISIFNKYENGGMLR